MKIEIPFEIDQDVYVTPLGKYGRVLGAYAGGGVTDVYVRYISDGEVYEEWFRPNELKAQTL